ncbi:MAG: hypothetical protein K1X85_01390 [Ignavibacteria bacterium]|nr:hypothetical protein [Ignavibacteria bacterium]
MKTNLIRSVLTIALAILSFLNVHAQDKKVIEGEIPAQVRNENNDLRKNKNAVIQSDEVIAFQNKMRSAKRSDSRTESNNLLNEIDHKLGTKTVSVVRKDRPAKDLSNLNLQLDNFDTSKIYQTQYLYSRFECVTTCTEQRGAYAGRIWTCAILRSGQYYHYIGVFYSDDNGSTWNVYSVFDAYVYDQSGYVQFFKFTIDSELIEGTNSRILYITYPSYTLTAQGVGPLNGLVTINLNTNQIDLGEISWPGMYTVDPPFIYLEFNTYNVKMVSDNSRYTNNAWLYFVAQCDSIYFEYPEFSKQGEKVAVCLDPYERFPSVSYNPGNFMGMITDGSINDFDADIAYFYNNGEDSVMVVESGLETNSSIAVGTASIFEVLTNCYYRGEINTNANARKNVSIASNGAYKDVMVVCENEYSEIDHDIEYYRSTNGSGGWSNGFIDYTIYDSKGNGILGKRNDPGNFSVAFNSTYADETYLSFCRSANYAWGNVLNPFSTTETDQNCLPYPAISFSGSNNFSVAVWSDDAAPQPALWSSSGFTGSNLTLLMYGAIQGMYDAVSNSMTYDTVTVYLRNSISPYQRIDSSRKQLYGPGTGQEFTFYNAQNNVPYYIEVKHRNALETWSADPVTFVSDNASIAFSVDAIYAYGNNQIQVDASPYNVFAFYSGDVNQDGTIDATDISMIDNDAANFVSGYVVTDLTGDDFVDGTDFVIADNNAANFVSVIRP